MDSQTSMVITPWGAPLERLGVVTIAFGRGALALCAQGFNSRMPPGVQISDAVSSTETRRARAYHLGGRYAASRLVAGNHKAALARAYGYTVRNPTRALNRRKLERRRP